MSKRVFKERTLEEYLGDDWARVFFWKLPAAKSWKPPQEERWTRADYGLWDEQVKITSSSNLQDHINVEDSREQFIEWYSMNSHAMDVHDRDYAEELIRAGANIQSMLAMVHFAECFYGKLNLSLGHTKAA